MYPIIIPIVIALILAQIFLSKKPRKYLGLIIPVGVVVFSITICIWFVMFGMVGTQIKITSTDGNVHVFQTEQEANEFKDNMSIDLMVSEENITDGLEDADFFKTYAPIIRLFSGINILTIFLLLIYHHYKEHRVITQTKELKKMSIKDI